MMDPIAVFGYVGYASVWILFLYVASKLDKILNRGTIWWIPVTMIFAGLMTLLSWLTLSMVVIEVFSNKILWINVALYLLAVVMSLFIVDKMGEKSGD